MNKIKTEQMPISEDHQNHSVSRWFVLSAGAILAISGIAKVWSAFGGIKLLAVVDPIFGIRFGHLMPAAGVAEIVIALVCVFNKSHKQGLGLVAWFSTSLVLYRFDLWWMHWKLPCSCLGTFTDALHITPQVADNIMKVILAYLFVGGYTLLVLNWWQNCAAIEGDSFSLKSGPSVK